MRGTGRADHGGAIKNQSRGSVFSRWASRICRRPLLGGAFFARAGWVGVPTRNQCASTSFEWWACWAALAKSLQME